MSDTLDYVREHYDWTQSVPDDELTKYVGDKYPDFLRADKDFARDYAKLSTPATRTENIQPSSEQEQSDTSTADAISKSLETTVPETHIDAIGPTDAQAGSPLKLDPDLEQRLRSGEALTQKYLAGRDLLAQWAPEKITKLKDDYETQLKGLGFTGVGDTDENLSKPLIPIAEPQGDGIRAGVDRALARVENSLQSPESLAMLAVGEAFPNVARALFGTMALKGAATDLGTAAGTQGAGNIAEAATSGLINSAFAGGLLLPDGKTPPVSQIVIEAAKKAIDAGAPLTARAATAVSKDISEVQAGLKDLNESTDQNFTGQPGSEAVVKDSFTTEPEAEAQTEGDEPHEDENTEENQNETDAEADSEKVLTPENAVPPDNQGDTDSIRGPLSREEFNQVSDLVKQQAVEPTHFETAQDVLNFRSQRLYEERELYKTAIGLSEDQAQKLQEAMTLRGGSTGRLEKTLTPEQKKKFEWFFEESIFNQKSGPWKTWDVDPRYDPESITHEDDKEFLTRSLASALGDRKLDLNPDSQWSDVHNDRFIYAALAAKKLEALGVTERQIGQAVMKRARNISGSQGDMDFSVEKSAQELRQFFDLIGVKVKPEDVGNVPRKQLTFSGDQEYTKFHHEETQDQTDSSQEVLTPNDAPPEQQGEASTEEMPDTLGVGAQQTGVRADQTSIEALTDAFKGIRQRRIPFWQQVKESFDVGKKLSDAKDAVGSAVAGLKSAGDFIADKWRGVDKIDDYQHALGDLSSEIEANGRRMHLFSKEVRTAMPDVNVREAISKWVDSGGDEQVLRDSLAKVPNNRKAPYERALKLTPEEKTAAINIQNFFESRLQEAIDAGVVDHGIEDYIHRIFEKDTDWKKGILAQVQAGVLNTRTPGLALKRFFKLDSEAEAAGYKVVSDFLPRIQQYERSLSKVIASRAAVKAFNKIKMEDGRPMVDVAGTGFPMPKNSGSAREATLINPSFKPGDASAEEAGSKNYRKDYIGRPEYSSLKKWKWVTKGEHGEPVFVQGDVLIHPDAVKKIDALLAPSKVRASPVGRAALALSSTFKNTMLDLTGFHQAQLAIHGAEHGVVPGMAMKEINLNDPTVIKLLKGGVTLGGDGIGSMSEGVFGKSLTKQIPGLGEMAQSYHEYLFQDFIPRLKMTMATKALDRNMERFKPDIESGKMSEEAVYHLTAKEANAAFGGLNQIMEQRGRTLQDVARLVLLAPDFLENRARFLGQAFTKRGGEQRMALLAGALTMWTVARIANYAISGQMHNEPENLFRVGYNGKFYGLRTIQGDLIHATTAPINFISHRLNPVFTRPILETLTGRDEFGRKRDAWQVLGDSISNIVPITLRSSREKSIWESIYNGFGGTESRMNDADRIYKLAAKWKEKNGVVEPGEFVYDRDKDIRRGLKISLAQNDESGAIKELRTLTDEGVDRAKLIRYFRTYATSHFAGSQLNDAKFKSSLSEDDQKTFDSAQEHKKDMFRMFTRVSQLVPTK